MEMFIIVIGTWNTGLNVPLSLLLKFRKLSGSNVNTQTSRMMRARSEVGSPLAAKKSSVFEHAFLSVICRDDTK